MRDKIFNLFFRFWYWYVSTIDKNAEVIFMNFGYSKNQKKIELEEKDKKDQYSAQLYHLVGTGIDIEGKEILEVGSGRGGGLSFINRYLKPKKVTGLDLCEKAVLFCNKKYATENAHFVQGTAENLPFADGSFDAVLNVESSHRYGNMSQFVKEVYRVLKPNGYLLLTDFRFDYEIEEMESLFIKENFKLLKSEDITENVVEALRLSTKEREELILKLTPKFLHGIAKQFAGTEGSDTYNKFATREYVYKNYVLSK